MTTLVINKAEDNGFTASDAYIAKCASKATGMIGKARVLNNDARILGAIALMGKKNTTEIEGVKVFSSNAQRTNITKGIYAALAGPTAKPLFAVEAEILALVVNNGRLVESTKCELGSKVRDETGLKILRAALGHCAANAAIARHLTAALAEVGTDTLTAANFAAVKSAFNAIVNNKAPAKKTKKTDGITLEQVLEFMSDPTNARLFVTNNGLGKIAAAYAEKTGEHSLPVFVQAFREAANV